MSPINQYGVHYEIERAPKQRLNDKGQCPVCKRKLIVYKRDRKLFCPLCDRTYSMETLEQTPNNIWKEIDGGRTFEREVYQQ